MRQACNIVNGACEMLCYLLSPTMSANHQPLTRTESARVLTCIEAFDASFEFMARCSGCDYYCNNRVLNALALKKPRSKLSYWQCCKPHNLGELSSSADLKTLYQPTPTTRYNRFCTSDRSCNSSNSKRVRLFSPDALITTHTESDNNRSSFPLNPVMDKVRLELELKKAVSECKKAILEKDEGKTELTAVVTEKACIEGELTKALEQYDSAISQHDVAVAQQYKLLCEHDSALNAREQTMNL